MSTQQIIEPDDDDEFDESAGTAMVVSGGIAIAHARAEIDGQVATAKAYPRDVKLAMREILQDATESEDIAEECIYALPRAGKPIKGPSIRFAEIVYQNWGNCRSTAVTLDVDRVNKMVVTEATFIDLEKNTAYKATDTMRIVNSRGVIYKDDMIFQTCKASQAKARRNAILGGVKKRFWHKAFEACEQIAAGTVQTLAARREKMIKQFAKFGVKPEQIFASLGIAALEDVTLEHMVTLTGMFNNLKSGDETVESMFARPDAKEKPSTLDKFAEQGDGGEKVDKATGEVKTAEPENTGEADTTAAQPREQATAGAPKADDKPGQTDAPAGDGPKTEIEYEAYAREWIAGKGTEEEEGKRWADEKKLRNSCGVQREARDRLAALLNEKHKAQS